jgi:transmembrane sensor
MTWTSRNTDDEAARWAVRIAEGPLPAQEQGELDAWLAASPRHQGALVRARAMWMDLDRFAAMSGGGKPRFPHPPKRVERRLTLAVAGIAVFMMIAAGAWLVQRASGDVYESEVGELRQVKLNDGSSMLLNTATKAVVEFDEAQREVHLTRGEAIFEVAKDPSRPFVVRAGEVTIRAVGTAFAVRRGETLDVTVTEGVVEIVRNEGTPAETVQRVAANQRAVLASTLPAIEVAAIDAAEANRRLAWRGGMIAFDGESLSDAVAEINRHSHRQIVVDDPELAASPVVGIFRATDVDTFVAAAEAALGAEAVDEGVVIRLRSTRMR